MLSSEVCTRRTCVLARTDVLGVAASNTLDTHEISFIQDAVIEGAFITKKDAMRANLPFV